MTAREARDYETPPRVSYLLVPAPRRAAGRRLLALVPARSGPVGRIDLLRLVLAGPEEQVVRRLLDAPRLRVRGVVGIGEVDLHQRPALVDAGEEVGVEEALLGLLR